MCIKVAEYPINRTDQRSTSLHVVVGDDKVTDRPEEIHAVKNVAKDVGGVCCE